MNEEKRSNINQNELSNFPFEQLYNDKEIKSSLGLNQEILRKKSFIKKILFSTLGKGSYLRKPSPLRRLEQGIMKKYFSKNGLLIDMMPKLRNEFINKEKKIKNALEDKINLGEMTFLTLNDKYTDTERMRENEMKRKLLLRSSNFLYRGQTITIKNSKSASTSRQLYPTSNIVNNIKIKVSNSKTPSDFTQNKNYPVSKFELYSPSSKIYKANNTLNGSNLNYTASTFYPNHSSFKLNESNTNTNTTNTINNNIFNKTKINKKKQKSKINNIKLNLINPNNTQGRFLLSGEEEEEKAKFSLLKSYISNGRAYPHKFENKQMLSYRNKTTQSIKYKKKISGKSLKLKIDQLGTSYNQLEKNLIDIIDDSKIDKKTNKFIRQDIETIFTSNLNQNSIKKTVTNEKSKGKENVFINQNKGNIDQEKFIENSLKNVAQRLSDTQAMNYIDKLMFGQVKKSSLNDKENEDDILQNSEKMNQENKKIKSLRKKLNNNVLKISKMRKLLIQKNIKLVKRLENDLEKDKKI